MLHIKRRVLSLLLAMLLLLPFAGCSSGAGKGDKANETVGTEPAENTKPRPKRRPRRSFPMNCRSPTLKATPT